MLQKEFSLIRTYLKNETKQKLSVSKGNVGWHIDHSLKVINSVSEALINSDPKDYKSRFNVMRFFAFTIGSFPRGKAKAPKRVLPPKKILKEDIKNQLELAVQNILSINNIEENQYFMHPLFKELNKKQTIKFLKLHTNHHLKIIRDILK
jgi:hypothetical protein